MANRMDWTIRVLQEHKQAYTAHFLTLTYEDDHLPYSNEGEPELDKTHLQKFFKRLRKENAKHAPKWQIRYFAIGEYGETFERPHYHAIMFNVHNNSIEKLAKIWPCGFHQLGTVGLASIHYVTGYIINRYADYGSRSKPFALHSRKPGLGNCYLETHAKWHKPSDKELHWRNFTKVNGITNRLPRYYRDRIFNKEELQWLNTHAAGIFDQELAKEIERISKTTRGDPHEAFKERVQAMHDKIKVKKNKSL
ncbi:replication initiator protein [Apis mellifera associated microvirus 36]|nr:replication initiator protein [Apis mellifera associated microvirus 36]